MVLIVAPLPSVSLNACAQPVTQPSLTLSPGAQGVVNAVAEYDQTAQATLNDAHAQTLAAQQAAEQYRQQCDNLQDQYELLQSAYTALQASTRPTTLPATNPIVIRPNYASTQPYPFVQDARGWTILPTPVPQWYI